MTDNTFVSDVLENLTKNVRETVKLYGDDETRLLVNTYYQIQDTRVAINNQAKALEREDKENDVLEFFTRQLSTVENQVKRALKEFCEHHPTAQWALDQNGIGEVIAAGLLAHIDITKMRYPSSVWRFAGLTPDQERRRGEKITWNPDLKKLSWKIGESFVKKPGYYNTLYKQRKAWEERKNEDGHNANAAAVALSKKRITNPVTRKIYESGKLPPGHVHARAKRWTAKIFLNHYVQVAYFFHHGKDWEVAPYVLERDPDHSHFVAVPPGGDYPGRNSI